MSMYYDALETRPAAEREAALLAALPGHIAQAQQASSAFAQILSGVDARSITSRAALAQLPVTRKHALLERQQALRTQDPLGGFATHRWGPDMPRVFSSPGPIYEPQGGGADHWRMARALYAAGFRTGELAHNCFSYHFVPAGAMMEAGAQALGCTVFPGGTGQTEQQVQAMAQLQPAGYIGTPSFLKIIVEKAQDMGLALPSLRKALLSAEAFPPSLRDWLAERGITAYQCYASADLGLIAYETSARAGLVLAEDILVEIVRPGSSEPVAEGEVGEVVVTSFNPAYPLIRFGTGDLSATLPGPCPTGRSNTRIQGWMGRADQTTKVRGMFVQPAQVAALVQRFPQVQRARLVVSGAMASDQLLLQVETRETAAGLATLLQEAARELTGLRAEVEMLPPGCLPNDGKVIEDARSYD